MGEQMTDAEVLRQLDEANQYRDIIITVLPRITQDAADDMSLRIRDYAAAQLANRDADIERLADINDHLRRQLDKANEIIVELNHMVAKQAGEIATLRAELAKWIELHELNVALPERSEDDAEIAALRQQVDAWQATGNAIMLCAVGREAPLSDSDVCGEINALRQQVAELQAWKDAVPVAEIVRYTFDQYDSTTIRPSDDWHKIRDWMDIVSPE